MKVKIKIITGYRKDQQHSIPAEESHKAYYLFLNPEARTVFSTGLALKGSDIQSIQPDYQGTMSWNPAHQLDTEDYNELRRTGVDRKVKQLMVDAQMVARVCEPQDLNLPLLQVLEKHLVLKQG